MKRKTSKARSQPKDPAPPAEDNVPAREEEQPRRIIERPDGFYWESKASGKEYGPYPTLPEAEADALAGEPAELEPGESLPEAESEIGMSEWIDPDTGGPAEDSVPRLEDH
jgi:hypothetical protein